MARKLTDHEQRVFAEALVLSEEASNLSINSEILLRLVGNQETSISMEGLRDSWMAYLSQDGESG